MAQNGYGEETGDLLEALVGVLRDGGTVARSSPWDFLEPEGAEATARSGPEPSLDVPRVYKSNSFPTVRVASEEGVREPPR